MALLTLTRGKDGGVRQQEPGGAGKAEPAARRALVLESNKHGACGHEQVHSSTGG